MDECAEQLEKVIKQMLQPLKNIPLEIVIKSLSGFDIIAFNKQNEKDVVTLNTLIKVAKRAVFQVNLHGIRSNRPNEVGNRIEEFVKNAVDYYKYSSETPKTKLGKKKATGYPDIEFVDQFGRDHYLECKTYNIANIATTQRSFYLSPSEDFKINKNAHHFILSFEVFIDQRDGTSSIFKVKSWKILSAEKMMVDVKYEFNSDNARMYIKDMILAEGNI